MQVQIPTSILYPACAGTFKHVKCNVYKQQLGLHKVHDQLDIGMSMPIIIVNVLTCHVKPSYKSTEGEIHIHTLSLSVNVTETYVYACELFTRLVWEYIHSSIMTLQHW